MTDTIAEATAARDAGDRESWLPVLGFEDRYEVSDRGRVRGLRSGVILRHRDNGRGYVRVCLWRPGVQRDEYVHRLVALAFLGPAPSRSHEVCHADGVRTNNVLSNLRWDTHGANMLDAVAAGTHRETRKTQCPRSHPLEGENLKASQKALGQRACLACDRARKRVLPPGMTLNDLADACYFELTGRRAPRLLRVAS